MHNCSSHFTWELLMCKQRKIVHQSNRLMRKKYDQLELAEQKNLFGMSNTQVINQIQLIPLSKNQTIDNYPLLYNDYLIWAFQVHSKIVYSYNNIQMNLINKHFSYDLRMHVLFSFQGNKFILVVIFIEFWRKKIFKKKMFCFIHQYRYRSSCREKKINISEILLHNECLYFDTKRSTIKHVHSPILHLLTYLIPPSKCHCPVFVYHRRWIARSLPKQDRARYWQDQT